MIIEELNYRELVANIFSRDQQVADINRSLAKLERRSAADATAIFYLEKARWTLCQERNQMEKELA